jgi:6-phosphogluconolactonase
LVLRVARRAIVFPDLDRASAALSRHVAAAAVAAVRDRGRFSLAISGGRTPAGLYRRWGGPDRRRLPWDATDVFFADERAVAPHHPDSNFGAAWQAFLSRVPIPRRRIHRMRGELRPLSTAAARYARQIGELGPPRGPPRFDVVLLGIGPDGHTASLFPGQPAVTERRRSVVVVRRAGLAPYVPRLSMTPPALSSAREVLFLVSGEDKAAVVGATFRAPPGGSDRLPASRVQGAGSTVWFLDRAAASRLPSSSRR